MMMFKRGRRRAAIVSADRARDEGDPALAARLYAEIIETFGPTAGLLKQLGNALKDSGEFTSARAAYHRVLSLVPDDADCFLQLGHLARLTGDHQASADHYRRSLEISPHNNPAREEYERCLREGAGAPAAPSELIRAAAGPELRDKIDVCFGGRDDVNGWDLALPALATCKRLRRQMDWRR